MRRELKREEVMSSRNKEGYMKKDIVIKCKGKYLVDNMIDLPDDSILHKGKTGCGMTSLALGNKVKYVVAVPTVDLVRNKIDWCKGEGVDVCAVYGGGAQHKDIIAFKGDKILTTYDSLGKVTKALQERGDIGEFKILIDEAHNIINIADFRGKAVRTVMNNYPMYRHYIFGTATPIKQEYQLSVLKNIPIVSIEWDQKEEVEVNYCNYNGPIIRPTAQFISEFLKGVQIGNAHFFINSVNDIISILECLIKAGYDEPENIRIICADSERNFDLLDKRLGVKYMYESVNSQVKKINFYTSTAFEGCDIYDKEGKIFIVVNGSKKYKKINLFAMLPQINGRLRDTIYKNEITFMYSESNFKSDITEAEYANNINELLKEAQVAKNKYDSETGFLKEAAREGFKSIDYFIVENDEVRVNEAYYRKKMHDFETINQTYYVSKDGFKRGIKEGKIEHNGTIYEYIEDERIELKNEFKRKLGLRTSFNSNCIEYIEKANNKGLFGLSQDPNLDPLIPKAYKVLGERKMKALSYRKDRIKRALIIKDKLTSLRFKIVQLLGLREGDWYSRYVLKKKLEKIYEQLDIPGAVKAKDIEKWYEVIPRNKMVSHISIAGYDIVLCRINVKSKSPVV